MSATADWRRSLLVALACVVGVRAFLTLYLAGAALIFPQPDLGEQYGSSRVVLLDSGLEGLLLGVWQREDALWYQKIATTGYSSGDMSVVFFPLLPMSMRLLSQATGMHPIAAGIVISELSLLAALFMLHRLLLPRFGSGVADRTLVYIGLFPTAFFLHAPFTESLTLALVVGSFYLISRGRWIGAVGLAYLAGLARPQGVLLGAALAVHWVVKGGSVRDWRSLVKDRLRLWQGTVLVAMPLLGLATFRHFVDTPWSRIVTSGGAGPVDYQSVAIPGTPLIYAAQRILAGAAYPIDVFDFVTAIAFTALTVAAFTRLDPGYSVCAALFLAAPLSRFSSTFALMAFSRYALLLFPCFVVLAIWGRRKAVHLAIIFLWLWWLAVWSAKFYTGYFVG